MTLPSKSHEEAFIFSSRRSNSIRIPDSGKSMLYMGDQFIVGKPRATPSKQEGKIAAVYRPVSLPLPTFANYRSIFSSFGVRSQNRSQNAELHISGITEAFIQRHSCPPKIWKRAEEEVIARSKFRDWRSRRMEWVVKVFLEAGGHRSSSFFFFFLNGKEGRKERCKIGEGVILIFRGQNGMDSHISKKSQGRRNGAKFPPSKNTRLETH